METLTIIENLMEKNMDNEMDTGIRDCFLGTRFSQALRKLTNVWERCYENVKCAARMAVTMIIARLGICLSPRMSLIFLSTNLDPLYRPITTTI